MKRREILGATGALAATAPSQAPAIARLDRKEHVLPWPKNTPCVGVNAERFASA
jgi:hypothetical protein